MSSVHLAFFTLFLAGCSSSSTNKTTSGGGAAGTGGSAGSGVDASSAGMGGESGDASVSDGAPSDAPADVPDEPDAEEPACLAQDFSFVPSPPKSPDFKVTYGNEMALTCIGWDITCSNGPPSTAPASPGVCSKNNCWATNVSGCAKGAVTIRFLKNKAHGVEPCLTGAGTEVAVCNLMIQD